MAEKQRIAVMVLIETDDPRLTRDQPYTTACDVAGARAAIVEALPTFTRVIFFAPEDTARAMVEAFQEAMVATESGEVYRPPPDYVPPVRG